MLCLEPTHHMYPLSLHGSETTLERFATVKRTSLIPKEFHTLEEDILYVVIALLEPTQHRYPL
jgi:hypothetical protein